MKGKKCKCGALYWGIMPYNCYVCKTELLEAQTVEIIDWEYELITNNKNHGKQ